MQPPIRVEGLTKAFGRTRALSGIDLEVPSGTVTALLGPNGAGKTTLVRILATLIRPDAGSARVAGLDVVRDAFAVRSRIGLTGQYAALDDQLTGRENLRLIGRLAHLGERRARSRTEELLALVGIEEAAGRPVSTYSGGMRRGLDIAAGLVGKPAVLFLDEPTTGLDPRGRIDIWELIGVLVRQGATLLLTTQYLEEADRLADAVAVIDRGRIVAGGTPEELKRRLGGEVLEVALADASDAEKAGSALGPIAAGPARFQRTILRIPVERSRGTVVAAVRRLDAAGVEADDVVLRRPTLDDVFLTLTGHAAGAEIEGGEEQVA
ncbi:MAG: ATP-binding cassette domain-containing protein [Candidatus Dormibacteraeota bacterium]|nr:ATP-binding cassette domain-containing protein [Candidatus Dormibacteraeota bacterium]